MKKVFLLFMSVTTFMSCTDEGLELKKPESKTCNVTEISLGTNNRILKFEYNNQGDVVKIVDNFYSLNSTDFQEVNFKYETNKITATDIKENIVIVYTLESSRITKSVSDDYTKIFQYNTDGYLTKITAGRPNEEPVNTNITYKDGNISEVNVSSDSGISWQNSDYYATYNNQPRLAYAEYFAEPFSEWFLVESAEAVLYEKGLMGKKIKNQIVSVKDLSETATFNYGNDNNGKPNSLTSNKSWGQEIFNFTFDCK